VERHFQEKPFTECICMDCFSQWVQKCTGFC